MPAYLNKSVSKLSVHDFYFHTLKPLILIFSFLFHRSCCLFLFSGGGGCAGLSCHLPSSCHPDSCGPPSTRPRWVSISITCWTALLPHLAKWLRALPGAGGAATTGKDVPVTPTLGTTVQSWRNSVSSAISPILGLFAFNPLHILFPTVSASSFPFLACGIPINNSDALAAHMATGEGPAGCFSSWAESRLSVWQGLSPHTVADDGLF